MRERLTEVRTGKAGALQLRGRVKRSDAIKQFREFYREQLHEANRALSAPDDAIETVTYIGCYAQRNKEQVMTDRSPIAALAKPLYLMKCTCGNDRLQLETSTEGDEGCALHCHKCDRSTGWCENPTELAVCWNSRDGDDLDV